MAIRGELQDMPLTTLISVNCNEQNRARLRLWHDDQEAEVYFDEGQIVHMTLGDQEGEEVIYTLLTWEDGQFELEMDVPPPARTVSTPWSNLVLEGMRLIDEGQVGEELESLFDQETQTQEEDAMAARKKRSELLREALDNLLANSTDIVGAAIVGIDGLVLSANVPVGGVDEALVGAAAAAIAGLSKRSVQQLKRGDFSQTLIRGDEGYIIVSMVDERNVFVGLTPANVNLGMVFVETREVVEELASIMASR